MSDKIGIIEIVVAVLISITGSWMYVKEDLAQLNTRVDRIEEDNRETVEINKRLSDTLNELNIVLAGLRAEMGHVKEGLKELRKDKTGGQ